MVIPTSRINRTHHEFRLDPPLDVAKVARVSVDVLDYAGPDDAWVRRVGVVAGGVLDQLRSVAEAIANAFGWKPVQGVIFVLAGVTPYIAAVRMSAPAFKTRRNVDVAWAARITLDIDPAATPDEVLEAFQSIRRQQGLTRLRP